MGVLDMPFSGNYLEYLPLNKIAKYHDGPPKNGIPFLGYPRQHPTENNKLILVYEPLGENPAVLEFKIDDILYVEDVPQVVTEKGEGVPLVRLWIRRGSHGMLLEPFEVDETLHFLKVRRGPKDHLKDRFMKQAQDDFLRNGSSHRPPESNNSFSG